MSDQKQKCQTHVCECQSNDCRVFITLPLFLKACVEFGRAQEVFLSWWGGGTTIEEKKGHADGKDREREKRNYILSRKLHTK